MYQEILRNPALSVESKAIYSYLAGYAGTTDECFPGIELMCKELNISKSRLYKHMQMLVDSGVVSKELTYVGNLKSKVVYRLSHRCDVFSASENLGIRELGLPRNEEATNNTVTINSIPYSEVLQSFNDTCVSYPKVTRLSDARKKTIRARFNEGYTFEDFQKLFVMAQKSTFLRGGNNRDWQANFDWLIKSSNMAKTLDGNYLSQRREVKKDDGLSTKSASSFEL